MSHFLWKYYLQDDFDAFQQLLANATFSGTNAKTTYNTSNTVGAVVGSPGRALATSPVLKSKLKSRPSTGVTLTRGDLNWKDSYGKTLLHHMATSTEPRATKFALLMLQVPLLDLYAQDLENGWTSLHRALYFGNITIARALMAKDIEDATGIAGTNHASGLIKIKDKEGNSPFDVYNDTIAPRILDHGNNQATISAQENLVDDASDLDEDDDRERVNALSLANGIDGDELYMFGTNKNYNLGFIDGDDRQFPERPSLQRPASLLRKHYREHTLHMSENAKLRSEDAEFSNPNSLPFVVRSKPLRILDVRLAKLHSAVLTTDEQCNLYVCGFGPGYRLGTGDDQTRFSFTSVSGGGLGSKKIVSVALGQNHTVAITSEGETFSWGSNAYGQLGYILAKESTKEEDQVQPLPRQIFGPLKRELIIGCAASKTHSVVHTRSSLYTFGKNEGQLGLVDADARSLEMQAIPRQVALSRFSSPIVMVSAIDKATTCLLENHDVLVFANYGYSKLQLPLDGFASTFARNSFFGAQRAGHSNHVVKICSGGNTICALTSEGEVLTVALKSEPSPNAVSTTNPSKIRDSVSATQKLWSNRKNSMAAKDVDVGQDGSVIICTTGGSVWRREKRAKIKDANTGHVKDYKFSRVPGLTRVTAVRSNAFGAFAAVRRDCDVMKTQILVEPCNLWKDLFILLPLRGFVQEENSDTEEPVPRFWQPKPNPYDPSRIRTAIIRSTDLEKDLALAVESLGSFDESTYDLKVGSTLSSTRIPIHSFLFTARSPVLRTGLGVFSERYFFSMPDVLTVEYDKQGHPVVIFQGLDILSLLALVFYLYTDGIVDVWHLTKNAPSFAFAYRQARQELTKLASMLELRELERATRQMIEPGKVLHKDIDRALADPSFLNSGDVEIELDGDSRFVHSALICQRCPFFEGLFFGRAGGGWLSRRREELEDEREAIKVDLTHIAPSIFNLVLRYLYADVDDDLFEDVVVSDLDSFLDLILDVAAVADELMLDRLAQICQKALGSFVTTRNVCQLLNAVAPYSVSDFKDAALEYLVLNLEGMLENGLLDELDEDLIVELDSMVQENQAVTSVYSRSGVAESELIERHPGLAALIDRGRQSLIDSVALRSRLHEDEARAEKLARNTSSTKSPQLMARAASSDLLFAMDEEGLGTSLLGKSPISPRLGPRRPSSRDGSAQAHTPPAYGRFETSEHLKQGRTPTTGVQLGGASFPKTPLDVAQPGTPSKASLPSSPGIPWGSVLLSTSKLDMKQIMAQTTEVRFSGISAGLASSGSIPKAPGITKLSQKERKRQQQQQREQASALSPDTDRKSSGSSKQSPWQVVSSGSKITLDEIASSQSPAQARSSPRDIRRTSSPGLTMRQTIPGNVVTSRKAATQAIMPSTTPPSAKRTISGPPLSAPSIPTTPSASTPTKPHSVRHHPSTQSPEPSLQLSMGDILAQQQREKQLLKEAVAKRSLAEIQEEQAFQDWWDKEEAATKARLEAEAAQALTKHKSRDGNGKRGGRRGGKVKSAEGGINGLSSHVPAGSGSVNAPYADKTDNTASRGGHSHRGRSSSRRGRRGGSSVATSS